MNARKLIAISLVLNLGLGLALGYFLSHRPPQAKAEPTPAPVPPLVARKLPARTVPPREASVSRDGFQWGSLESADFKQYMANLRSIGCPEETIRDLIMAEVNKLMAPKFVALAAEANRLYWKSRNGRGQKTDLRAQMAALQKERKDILVALLGNDVESAERWFYLDSDALTAEGRFAFLSPEKQKLVRDIFERYKAQENGVGSGVELRKIREQRREELARLLTPEELGEMDLRDSNTANAIRSRFASADLTEMEFRKLVALRKSYEDEQGFAPEASDPDKMQRRAEARRQLEENYKNALGDQRFAQIQREQDPSWRGLERLGEQHSLTPMVLEQAYQYQKQAAEQMSQLFAEPNAPREDRRAAMAQLTAQTEKNMRELLGDAVYEEYRKSNPQISFSRNGNTMSFNLPNARLNVPETVEGATVVAPGPGGRGQRGRTRTLAPGTVPGQ